ncbi:MAG: hypothetical protein OEV78_11265 [Spirochaetia bacterium]|nr:hypothetical protein [Spirochaetia bacterium]
MIKKAIICVFIFLWFSAFLYGQNSGSKVNTENTIKAEQAVQAEPKGLYPKFNILIGFNMLMPGYNYIRPSPGWSLPPEREKELIPPYKGYDFSELGSLINVYWFLFQNFGLTFGLERHQPWIFLYDSNNNPEGYFLFSIYAAYVGLQARYLLGEHVIFGKALSDEEKQSNPYQYCCSVFAEFKIGTNYLYYEPEYASLLKRMHGKDFPVINPEDLAFGLAWKFRFGATFYFPRILLEMSLDIGRYEVTSKGIHNGLGGGIGFSYSIGFYL